MIRVLIFLKCKSVYCKLFAISNNAKDWIPFFKVDVTNLSWFACPMKPDICKVHVGLQIYAHACIDLHCFLMRTEST